MDSFSFLTHVGRNYIRGAYGSIQVFGEKHSTKAVGELPGEDRVLDIDRLKDLRACEVSVSF